MFGGWTSFSQTKLQLCTHLNLLGCSVQRCIDIFPEDMLLYSQTAYFKATLHVPTFPISGYSIGIYHKNVHHMANEVTKLLVYTTVLSPHILYCSPLKHTHTITELIEDCVSMRIVEKLGKATSQQLSLFQGSYPKSSKYCITTHSTFNFFKMKDQVDSCKVRVKFYKSIQKNSDGY